MFSISFRESVRKKIMDNVCKIHVVEITLMIKFIYETVDFIVKYENFIKRTKNPQSIQL